MGMGAEDKGRMADDMSETFEEAREQIHAFKPGEVQDYAVAFVRTALALLEKGVGHICSDAVPESVQVGGGVPGTCVRMLIAAHVIQPVYFTLEAEGIFGGRKCSSRKSAHGRSVPVYALRGRAIAETFLERNGANVERGQRELSL